MNLGWNDSKAHALIYCHPWVVRIFWRGSRSTNTQAECQSCKISPAPPSSNGFPVKGSSWPPRVALRVRGREYSSWISNLAPLKLPSPHAPTFGVKLYLLPPPPPQHPWHSCPVSYIILFNQNLDPSICRELSLLDLWAQDLWKTAFLGINLPTEAGPLLLPGFLEMHKFQRTKILYRIWLDLKFFKSLHRRRFC